MTRGRHTTGPCRAVLGAALVLSWAAPAGAQHRPLVTEDPRTIGAHRVGIEAGVEVARGVDIPLYGLTGDLLLVPFGLAVGLGDVGELQIETGVQRLDVLGRRGAPFAFVLDYEGTVTSAPIDAVIATKVRLITEGRTRPAVAVRFATRLPNARNQSGLGTDAFEFSGSVLAGKTLRAGRVAANLGLAIMGDALRPSQQNDALTYGVSLVRPLAPAAAVVAEVAGRAPPFSDETAPGAESQSALRVGLRVGPGSWAVDGGVTIGLTPRDADWGFFAGVSRIWELW